MKAPFLCLLSIVSCFSLDGVGAAASLHPEVGPAYWMIYYPEKAILGVRELGKFIDYFCPASAIIIGPQKIVCVALEGPEQKLVPQARVVEYDIPSGALREAVVPLEIRDVKIIQRIWTDELSKDTSAVSYTPFLDGLRYHFGAFKRPRPLYGFTFSCDGDETAEGASRMMKIADALWKCGVDSSGDQKRDLAELRKLFP